MKNKLMSWISVLHFHRYFLFRLFLYFYFYLIIYFFISINLCIYLLIYALRHLFIYEFLHLFLRLCCIPPSEAADSRVTAAVSEGH